jgi:hypothetical protein
MPCLPPALPPSCPASLLLKRPCSTSSHLISRPVCATVTSVHANTCHLMRGLCFDQGHHYGLVYNESGASCRSRAGTFASLLCLCAPIGLLCCSHYVPAALQDHCCGSPAASDQHDSASCKARIQNRLPPALPPSCPASL